MIKFENATNGRFYYIHIEKDLLNDCILRINYGGVSVTRHRAIFCKDHNSLNRQIGRIIKKRLSRGYSLVT